MHAAAAAVGCDDEEQKRERNADDGVVYGCWMRQLQWGYCCCCLSTLYTQKDEPVSGSKYCQNTSIYTMITKKKEKEKQGEERKKRKASL